MISSFLSVGEFPKCCHSMIGYWFFSVFLLPSVLSGFFPLFLLLFPFDCVENHFENQRALFLLHCFWELWHILLPQIFLCLFSSSCLKWIS
ncbi:hypothetical protein VIGAN_09099600 [Vigna angularis var. angularis]|uniref:Uncharacterized protein n=1 Tax=Vigna angularis var. angularis TaxID=157739 RepID=A0A0S3SX56_PHAAN|nr:hypothetical protein VIGAN_09099600 [Vigna angularis var. angularis]